MVHCFEDSGCALLYERVVEVRVWFGYELASGLRCTKMGWQAQRESGCEVLCEHIGKVSVQFDLICFSSNAYQSPKRAAWVHPITDRLCNLADGPCGCVWKLLGDSHCIREEAGDFTSQLYLRSRSSVDVVS